MANKKKEARVPIDGTDLFTIGPGDSSKLVAFHTQELEDELSETGRGLIEPKFNPNQEQISEENKAHLKFTLEWLHYLSKGSRSVEFRRQAKAAAASLSKLL
jgi:hypothetical protein